MERYDEYITAEPDYYEYYRSRCDKCKRFISQKTMKVVTIYDEDYGYNDYQYCNDKCKEKDSK